MKTYQEFCEAITKQLFDIIDANGSLLTWQKMWDSNGSACLPIGANGRYHGSNLLWLLGSQFNNGYKSNHWLTFNQIKQRGGAVKKGAKGHDVCFWKLRLIEDVKENDTTEEKTIPLFKHYYVFNLDQTTLDEAVEMEPVFSSNDIDTLIANLGVTISHFGGKAYYNGNEDLIVMPEKKYFKSANNYYATLLHELCHYTGLQGRLPRACFDNYDRSEKDRAQEELIAEIGSVFLATHFGLKAELENHASYVQGWKMLLSEKEVMSAVNKATKAFEWILDHAFATEAAIAA
ncbi:MAG: zincin-like metallopeptidase domain-containing protein [Gammaproteobacteria bacterium]|nr:zincin-like metallopeptidase domain-containing protein [Gammaproteobacteria bacterium]